MVDRDEFVEPRRMVFYPQATVQQGDGHPVRVVEVRHCRSGREVKTNGGEKSEYDRDSHSRFTRVSLIERRFSGVAPFHSCPLCARRTWWTFDFLDALFDSCALLDDALHSPEQFARWHFWLLHFCSPPFRHLIDTIFRLNALTR